jgi:hypothetical protein
MNCKKHIHPFDIFPSYGFQRGEETKYINWLWNYKKQLKSLVESISQKRDQNDDMMRFYILLRNERDEVNVIFISRLHSKNWQPYVDHALLSNRISDECREYIKAKREKFINRVKY